MMENLFTHKCSVAFAFEKLNTNYIDNQITFDKKKLGNKYVKIAFSKRVVNIQNCIVLCMRKTT